MQAGQGGQQELGVGMARLDQHPLGRTELDLLAGVGHRDAVAEIARQPDVVGDEDHRDAGILFEILEQVHDLRLHADIERGGRLIEDEQIGVEHERGGDDHALLWPPLSSWG